MVDALERTGVANENIDLRRFEQGGQLPGTYSVDIWLNGERVRRSNINFVTLNDSALVPELTRDILQELGIRISAFPELNALPADTIFTDPGAFIPGASTRLDFDQQRLDFSIPQAALDMRARGSVDPSRWDQGIPAALLNYSISGSRNWQKHGDSQDTLYMNLRSGLNIGPWRLRNYSTGSKSNDKQQFSSMTTTLSRDLQVINGQLELGETSTPGDIFDSFMFRGAQIYSDDAMLPDSMRGYAPVIRGIARSNAMVTIKQNGYTVYQSYVAPGSFEIRDLYPTASRGDLNVTVKEADGSEQQFVQPFSSVPMMLREGRLKYTFSGGEYRTTQPMTSTPGFGLATLAYGISNRITAYSGIMGAENYRAGVLGSGISFGDLGSISTDVTFAQSTLNDIARSHHTGQSYRAQYSKTVATTDTTITLASYRYSTEGFFTFQEVNESARERYNRRSRHQLNLSQSLASYGSVYVSAYQQDYWRQSGYERSVSTGYNTSFNGISYSLGYTYSSNPGIAKNNQQLAFTMQVPLDKWLNNSWASYSMTSQKSGPVVHQAGLSGTALTGHNLSYSVQQIYDNYKSDAGGSLSGTYRGAYGTVNTGYNYSRDYRQANFGIQGGVLAHENGITLSQPLGDSITLVKAAGAAGVGIQNNTGVSTDWRGYAVVPHASAYQNNRIAIDTNTLSPDTEIEEAVVGVVPTRGAVVRAIFNARTGQRALLILNYKGKPVPFGALVKQKGQENINIVGENGEVYLSGLNEATTLSVNWNDKTCVTQVRITTMTSGGIMRQKANCT
ncbi:fimbrial biogenesis outer membrane usher protein [Enterobacter hormaechei]|uniref:fimbria/pilus outer membrane usher protein n=1 Tax=Enterobacter hormaechei TaxID=158836 RepID=UPI0021CE2D43|nr:fimbria/pilus outer membrane usher protein [Enterobacter hormaechei]MCU6154361.1 fimbrial biogenesis outer membrane usher protein [Enterobacter hormaechei]